jgi:hypothetical protein
MPDEREVEVRVIPIGGISELLELLGLGGSERKMNHTRITLEALHVVQHHIVEALHGTQLVLKMMSQYGEEISEEINQKEVFLSGLRLFSAAERTLASVVPHDDDEKAAASDAKLELNRSRRAFIDQFAPEDQ